MKYSDVFILSNSLVFFIYFLFIIIQQTSSQQQDDYKSDESNSEPCGFTNIIPGDIRTKIPWTAGIFLRTKQNGPFKFLVTGAVIGPTTIITLLGGSFGGLHKNKSYSLPSSKNLLVGTGLKSTVFEDIDEHSQIAEVKYIIPNNFHHIENKEYHFFLIHLKSKLNLTTPYTRAVCIFELLVNNIDIENWIGWTTYFSGFTTPLDKNGSLVPKLLSLQITKGSTELCDSAFNYHYGRNPNHEYCLRLTPGQTGNDTCVLFGSACVIDVTGIWFIGGLMAMIPRRERGQCGSKTLYYFTDFIWCREWILRNLKCSPDKFACQDDGKCIQLNQVCNSQKDCSDGWDEDPIFCEAVKTCPYGYHQCHFNGNCIFSKQICDGIEDCSNGSDELLCNTVIRIGTSEILTMNIKNNEQNYQKCQIPPIFEGVIPECYDSNKQKLNCSQATLNTHLTLKCAPFYSSVHNRITSVTMKCQSDGLWRPYRIFNCQPDCGLMNIDINQPYIANGQPVNSQVIFPWHVAIFRTNNDLENYQYLCGGSLIEPNVIVTVAHCIVELGPSKKLLNVNDLRVVISPISTIFYKNIQTQDSKAQIYNVEKTWIPPTFDPSSLQSDIAIVKLTKLVKYNENIRPVCYLPKFSVRVPLPGTIGKVPGFGYNENNQISSSLKYTNYPVVSSEICSESFNFVLRLSTFCAGYRNGTAVCQGDSGGGLVFPEQLIGRNSERYVLRGIVSHGELTNARYCDQGNYAVFTHTDAFSDWILDILESIDASDPDNK